MVAQPGTQKKGATLEEVKTVRVIFSFEAGGAAGGCLTLKAGEEVTILDESQDGSWLGMNSRGEGRFPSNFVTLNPDKPKWRVCKWADRTRVENDNPTES